MNNTHSLYTTYTHVIHMLCYILYTFSMHGAKNYPFKKQKSDLDIPLDDNTDDELYLNILISQLFDL